MVNMISIILQDVVAENIKPESKNEEIPGWMWWKTWRSPMKWRWNDWRTWWNPIWDIPGYRWMKPDENMTKCWRPLSSGMKVRKYKMKRWSPMWDRRRSEECILTPPLSCCSMNELESDAVHQWVVMLLKKWGEQVT